MFLVMAVGADETVEPRIITEIIFDFFILTERPAFYPQVQRDTRYVPRNPTEREKKSQPLFFTAFSDKSLVIILGSKFPV